MDTIQICTSLRVPVWAFSRQMDHRLWNKHIENKKVHLFQDKDENKYAQLPLSLASPSKQGKVTAGKSCTNTLQSIWKH